MQQTLCHSNVQPDGGVGAPDIYTVPQWGTVTGCYGCHAGTTGTDRSRHANITSGSHDKHFTNKTDATYECLICHNWFAPNNTGSGCMSCHPSGSINAEKTLHVDGKVDLVFRSNIGSTASYSGTPAPGDGYGSCANIFCHGDGTHIRTGNTTISNTTPQWGAAVSGCTVCHGNAIYPSPSDGMPAYANNSPKENSHIEHVIDNGIGCRFCHYGTTTDGTSINNPVYHGNNFYNMTIKTTVPYDQYLGRNVGIRMYYAPPTKSENPNYGGACREVSCHGSLYPNQAYMPDTLFIYWGVYQKCGDCHLQKANTSKGGVVGQGDVNDYSYGNGTMAMIDSDQWSFSGHGKTSGSYDISLNPAANLTGAANCPSAPSATVRGCDQCLYCHEDSVTHNNAGNPFRLSNFNVLGNGWNDACLVCHKTGSSGYDPDSTGIMASKNAAVKINKFHNGADHGASNDGGSLCWDCHDPHGDRVSGSGNIYMVHTSVMLDKSDAYGRPSSTASPSFTNDAAGTDFIVASPGPYTGICNVCHTVTNHHRSNGLAPGDWDGIPGSSNYLGHNNGTQCITCHYHSGDITVNGNAFAHP